MRVLDYIQAESDRQSATLDETINMVEAWKYAVMFDEVPNLDTIRHLSYLITGNAGYRIVPAVFNQGRPAVKAELIPNQMRHWHTWFTEVRSSPSEYDALIKEFLEIHPFADGNGRVASLLYNHLRGSLKDPVLLPYYFGAS